MSSFRQHDVETPHFQMPFRMGGINGGAFVNEQDTIEDIQQCARTVIAYPIGSREELPAFGTPDFVFKSSNAAQRSQDHLKAAILAWEQRAALSVDGEPILSDTFLQGLTTRLGTTDA